MPVGIEFMNEAGNLLLTTLRANPVVRQKSTIATVTNDITTAPVGSKLTLTYTNASGTSNPIPFLQGDVIFHFISGVKSGSTWTWIYIIDATVGTNVTCYVFDEPPNTYGNNGIEIYADDPSMPLLFGMHSSLKPFRIAAITAAAGSLTAGRTYAAAAGKRSGFLIWEPGARDDLNNPNPDWYAKIAYGHTVELAGNTISFGSMQLDPAPSTTMGDDTPDYGEERNWPLGPALVADVTGY